jgi:hypothetical protein
MGVSVNTIYNAFYLYLCLSYLAKMQLFSFIV